MSYKRGQYECLVMKPNCTRLRGTFQCNSTSDPSTATFTGNFSGFTVTYGATGKFTVTLPAGFRAPNAPNILVSNSCIAGTPFTVQVDGTYSSTARTFVIAAYDYAGSAVAPANNASNTITFDVEFIDTTGK